MEEGKEDEVGLKQIQECNKGKEKVKEEGEVKVVAVSNGG